MATAGKIRIIPKIIPMTKHHDPTAQEESKREVPLIFELSTPQRRGVDLPPREAGQKGGAEILGADLCRDDLPGFPELHEPQVLRHFLRLSHLNFALALQFYPLGSCTMKYNPLLNDEMASLRGFTSLHPRTPAHLAQGAFELMARLEAALAEITGMDAVTLHPAAGAQGELTGLMMIRAYHKSRGNQRHKVITPDTAHGTNPASCTLAGFEVKVARSNQRGFLEASEIERLLDDDVAALMVTNPNTLGIFEPQIQEIAGRAPCARRPALPRRRQHERADGRREAWAHGRRYRAAQPAQNFLDSAWRRRTRRRSGRGEEASGAVPADSATAQSAERMGVR